MRELTEREIRLINFVAKNQLEYLGYPIKQEPVKPKKIEEIYYRAHQAIIGEIQIQYRWRLAKFKRLMKKSKAS